MRPARPLTLTFVFIVCAACYSWGPVPGNAPLSGIPVDGDETLRITPRDGRAVQVKLATVQGDSLVGINAWDNQRYAIARSDVKAVEARQLGKSETLGATFGAIIVIGAVVIGVSLAALSTAPL